MTKVFVTVLKVNLGRVNEDLVWVESWLNFLIPLETAIAITFLVMNLSTLLSRVFCGFLWQLFQITCFFSNLISKSDVLPNFKQQKLIFAFA